MTTQKSPKTAKAKEIKKAERYIAAVGRRKTAVARVWLIPGGSPSGRTVSHGTIMVNGREAKQYFPLKKFQTMLTAPFAAASMKGAAATVKVSGGGVRAQAEAIRLGIARALVAHEPAFRPRLKTLGFLKRDPRMVERKKPGLRKARRPQQWRKR